MFRFQILQIFANSMWCYPGPSQVQQLSGTARVLAPGVYLFSKRAENILIQKDPGEMGLTIIWLELNWAEVVKNSSAFGVPKKKCQIMRVSSFVLRICQRTFFLGVSFILFYPGIWRWQWRSVRLWIWKHLSEEPTSNNYLLLIGTHHWRIQFWLIDVFSCAQEVCFRRY